MCNVNGYESLCNDTSAITYISTKQEKKKKFEEDAVEDTVQVDDKYDFIIIGAGAAGSVVANRLTENHQWKVLLLEAGGQEPFEADIPANQKLLLNSHIDWQYRTEFKEHACLSQGNHTCPWPAGKVLGGSTTINNMVYTRGNRRNFDEWASLGNTGWRYEEVLPYFLKSEDNQNEEFLRSPYHSKGGYLPVQRFPYIDCTSAALVEGFKELGVPNRDVNGQSQIGAMMAQTTSLNGERYSTAKSFLRPIKSRPNLHISINSLATKVLINEKCKKAWGVQFHKGGKHYIVRAKKEIILSAGAIQTPHLLMLSGIGPEDHLKEHGIRVIRNLKVGYNLHDHVSTGGVVFSIDKTATYPVSDETKACDKYNYFMRKEGPLTSSGAANFVAFLHTKQSNLPDDYPDIEVRIDPSTSILVNTSIGARNKVPLPYYDYIIFRPICLHPFSRGMIRLRSKNYWDHPLIYANYLDHPHDIEKLMQGINIAFQLENTQAFKDIGARIITEPVPGCTDFQFGTHDYWVCVIRHYTKSFNHYVGTCKMGPCNDKSAVVDPKLRVYGVKSLRVIDASIMPVIVSAHTMTATIMIGEKGSDLIKADWS